MTQNEMPDFDTLMTLAKRDPAGFDVLKQDMTRALIERAPAEHQKRLRGIQFQVDMEARRAKEPHGRIRTNI